MNGVWVSCFLMDCKTSPFILLPPSPSCFSSSPCSSSFSSYTSCFTELQSHQDKLYPYYMSLKYGGYLDRNGGRNNCSYNDNKSPYWVPLTATRELFVRLYIVLRTVQHMGFTSGTISLDCSPHHVWLTGTHWFIMLSHDCTVPLSLTT